MNETFGTRLRLQRERQQIDLAAISASTKISITLLERLERDEVDRWPVGIFRRAYVRAYAAAIGLEPEAVLREFLERYPDPTPLDPFSVAEAADGAAGRASGTRLGQIVRSAIAAMPGFLQRSSRPEISPVRLALESADDRETWDFDPGHEVGHEVDPHHPVTHRDVTHRDDDVAPAGTRDRPASAFATATADTPAPTGATADRVVGSHDRGVGADTLERQIEASRDASHDVSPEPRRREPNLMIAAALCTRFAQVREWHDVEALLGEVARVVEAVGLVVWAQAGRGDALVAVLAHGYPPSIVARMPVVPRTADNAIAAAFRSAQRSVVPGEAGSPGALVVPLLSATGCAGVLALELADGAERSEGVSAFAEIVAAQLAPLLGTTPGAEAVSA
jgi:hypothetical protein